MNTIKKNEGGFTLVELSMVILISGLILSGFFVVAKQVNDKRVIEYTERSLDNAQRLIDSIVVLRGYPCPADPALPPTSPAYGQEDCSLTPVNGVLVGFLPTKMQNTRGTGPFYSIFSAGFSGAGAAEFDLNDGLKTDLTSGWGDEMVYAVTALLTAQGPGFDERAGAVSIQDENGGAIAVARPSLTTANGVEGGAHYAIVSLGENNDIPCGSGPLAVGVVNPEFENCDGDDVFVSAVLNASIGATQFDDELRFKVGSDITYWREVSGGANGTRDIQTANLPVALPAGVMPTAADATRVGIGVATPQEKLEVAGTIRADLRAMSEKICNKAGDRCFDIRDINEFDCIGSGQYMRRIIINGADIEGVECVGINILETGYNSSTAVCPTGQWLRGVYSDGRVECN